jgi:hypothetical protein
LLSDSNIVSGFLASVLAVRVVDRVRVVLLCHVEYSSVASTGKYEDTSASNYVSDSPADDTR